MKLDTLKKALSVAITNDAESTKDYLDAYEELVELDVVRKEFDVPASDPVRVVDGYSLFCMFDEVLYDDLGRAAMRICHTENQIKNLTPMLILSDFKKEVHNNHFGLRCLTNSDLLSAADTIVDLWRENELAKDRCHTASGRYMTYDRELVDKLYNGYLEKLQESDPRASFEDVCSELVIENFDRDILGDIVGEIYPKEEDYE